MKKLFDYGSYIFYQTIKHANTCATKLPIAFPTLICGSILQQHPGILSTLDSRSKSGAPLSLHRKLFEGEHVPDIVSTSAGAENKTTSKGGMIIELTEVCKEAGFMKMSHQMS